MRRRFGTDELVGEIVGIKVTEVEPDTRSKSRAWAHLKIQTGWGHFIDVAMVLRVELEVETDNTGVRYYERARELPKGGVDLFYRALSPLLPKMLGITIDQEDFATAFELSLIHI